MYQTEKANFFVKHPFLTFLLVLLLGCGLYAYLSYGNINHYENVAVNDFITQQNIRANDGNASTVYKYLVVTDKGVFQINTNGLYAAQHCFGKIKVGDTLNITTRGFRSDFWGIYEHIMDAEKCWRYNKKNVEG